MLNRLWHIAMSLYVRHISMLLCLVDYNVTMIDTLRHLEMFVRLWLSYMFVTLQCPYMYVTLWLYYVWSIATLLCSTYWDVCKCLSHCDVRICLSHFNVRKCLSYYDWKNTQFNYNCEFYIKQNVVRINLSNYLCRISSLGLQNISKCLYIKCNQNSKGGLLIWTLSIVIKCNQNSKRTECGNFKGWP